MAPLSLANEPFAGVNVIALPQSRLRSRISEASARTQPVDYCLWKMVEMKCAEVQIKTHVVLEMTSPEGIIQAVTEGAGLTILPDCTSD